MNKYLPKENLKKGTNTVSLKKKIKSSKEDKILLASLNSCGGGFSN